MRIKTINSLAMYRNIITEDLLHIESEPFNHMELRQNRIINQNISSGHFMCIRDKELTCTVTEDLLSAYMEKTYLTNVETLFNTIFELFSDIGEMTVHADSRLDNTKESISSFAGSDVLRIRGIYFSCQKANIYICFRNEDYSVGILSPNGTYTLDYNLNELQRYFFVNTTAEASPNARSIELSEFIKEKIMV